MLCGVVVLLVCCLRCVLIYMCRVCVGLKCVFCVWCCVEKRLYAIDVLDE